MFVVCIADGRREPVSIQGRTDFFLFHGLLWLRFRFRVHLPCGMARPQLRCQSGGMPKHIDSSLAINGLRGNPAPLREVGYSLIRV